MTLEQVNNRLSVFTWFLYSKIMQGKLVLCVSEAAPSFQRIQEIPLIRDLNIYGICRLSS